MIATKQDKLTIGWSILLLLIVAFASLAVGTVLIAPLDVAKAALVKMLPPLQQWLAVKPVFYAIVGDIRWPRTLLALIAGAGLAVAGACYQTLFRNSLADPFILGVSSGAALGAAAAIILGITAWMAPLAFVGALASMLVVYFLAGGIMGRVEQVLLAGVACSALLNALLSAAMALYARQVEAIIFWLMGSVSNFTANINWILWPVLLGIAVVLIFGRDLDILTLGEDNARYLGVNVERLKWLLLLVVTIMTAIIVAATGIIGFVGLIVPHSVRRIAGPRHSLLLPLSAIWGGIFLLLADDICRLTTAFISTVPIGVITALAGGPFFLLLLYRERRRLKL